MANIKSGEMVLAVLHSPREKLIGVLHEINASGVFLRAIDLNYFDEWTNAIKNNEPYLPMQDLFVPMWRVERVSRDETSFGLASMSDQFRQKTGLEIFDF